MHYDEQGYAVQDSPDESVVAAAHNARHLANRCPGCDWDWMKSLDPGCCDACKGRGPHDKPREWGAK